MEREVRLPFHKRLLLDYDISKQMFASATVSSFRQDARVYHFSIFVVLAASAIIAVATRTRSKRRRRTMSYGGIDGKHIDIGGE